MLTLPIRKKWFDMILEEDKDKRKKEEYRTLNEYWGKRFATALGFTGKDAVGALNKYIQSHGQTIQRRDDMHSVGLEAEERGAARAADLPEHHVQV